MSAIATQTAAAATNIAVSPDVATRPGAGFAERRVEADGFSLRYLESGSGDPLLMLHGGGGIEMNSAHDLLAEQFRVIVLELPGFGETENTRTQTLGELADTVAAFADAIGLDTFRLLGTSFGGATALWVAVRHQARVSHLVLEVPAAFRAGGLRPHDLTPEQMFHALRAHPERKPWLTPPDPVAMGRRLAVMARIIGPDHDPALEAALADMMVPTVALFGTRDGLIGTDTARHYARIVPQCSVQLLYDAGHDPSGDRPEAFVDVVADFLRRGLGFNVTHRPTLLNP